MSCLFSCCIICYLFLFLKNLATDETHQFFIYGWSTKFFIWSKDCFFKCLYLTPVLDVTADYIASAASSSSFDSSVPVDLGGITPFLVPELV
jgi:hypothetical protein